MSRFEVGVLNRDRTVLAVAEGIRALKKPRVTTRGILRGGLVTFFVFIIFNVFSLLKPGEQTLSLKDYVGIIKVKWIPLILSFCVEYS